MNIKNLIIKLIFGTILIIAFFTNALSQSKQINDSTYQISKTVYDNMYQLMIDYLATDSLNQNLKKQIEECKAIVQLQDTVILKQDTVILNQSKTSDWFEGINIGYYGHSFLKPIQIEHYIFFDIGLKIEKVVISGGLRFPIKENIKTEFFINLKYRIL